MLPPSITDHSTPVVNCKNNAFGERFVSFAGKDALALATLISLFLLFGTSYHRATPLWNPPDEERHFAYCEFIARHHALPSPKLADGESNITQLIHPPLYYALASLLYHDGKGVIQEAISFSDGPGFARVVPASQDPEHGYAKKEEAAHLMRIFSIFLGAITVCGIYLLVLIIFPGHTALASASALFAAMNPQFLHISASVSNENLGSSLSTIYLLALLRYVHSTPKVHHHVITGVLLGCVLLSKLSIIFYLPLTAGVLIWALGREKKKLAAGLMLVFGSAFLVGGWWYIRNWALTGDPFLAKLLAATQPWAVRRSPLSLSDVSDICANTLTSFFGYFGAFQIPLPGTYLFMYAALVAGGIAGLALLPRKRRLTPFQQRALILLFLTLMGGAGTFLSLNLKYIGTYMGRYFFPVLAPIAVGVMVGLDSLFPSRWSRSVLAAISLLLIALNLTVLGRVLKPAYARTELVAGVDQPLFSHPTVELGASTIAQTFVASEDNLSAIRVMFSSPQQLKRGEVSFFLSEGTQAKETLHHITLPLKKMSDCTRYFFIFPPIKDSKGKAYTFRFTSSLPSGNKLSLWYEPTDAYQEGRLLINSQSPGGDLYFTTYHFTGTRPVTEWQGCKETVINHGMYVDVRELQLYHEQSKEFRERTITHQKIERAVKAVENRSLLLSRENA